LPKVFAMFDLSGFEAGSAAVALTGAVLGWSLRPLFLRYRRSFVVAVAVLAAAGAAAYDAFEEKPSPIETASTVVPGAPPRAVPAAPPGPVLSPANEAWADYLDLAGRNAFADGNYDAASRYWQDASRSSPRRAAELAEPIARAQLLALARR
jgi:hypothetical protein